MQQEQCPFCKTIIPPGATVCSGCQAERHVGPGEDDLKMFGMVGGGAGGALAWALSFGLIYGVVALAIGAGIGGIICSSVNGEKVTWKRMQRTSN